MSIRRYARQGSRFNPGGQVEDDEAEMDDEEDDEEDDLDDEEDDEKRG